MRTSVAKYLRNLVICSDQRRQPLVSVVKSVSVVNAACEVGKNNYFTIIPIMSQVVNHHLRFFEFVDFVIVKCIVNHHLRFFEFVDFVIVKCIKLTLI